MENECFFETLKTVLRFIWGNNSKVIIPAGIIALAVGYIFGSSSVVLGAWISVALLSLMSLIYSEKRIQELEAENKD